MSVEDPTDSISLVLAGFQARLRRRADEEYRRAMSVLLLQSHEFKPAEIKERLGLSDSEYRAACRWIEEEASPLLRGGAETAV